jgi:hypothetical protein
MAGLVPAIHVFLALRESKTWMPGTRPGMTSFTTGPYFIGCLLTQRVGWVERSETHLLICGKGEKRWT